MPTFEMQMETEHPVLFLSDAAEGISIPADTGQAFAMATTDCISFWVLSHVDGATRVIIADRDCETGGRKLFQGSINAPSGVVTLSDSSSFRYLNVPVPRGQVPVDLWADDDKNPEWV